jgi:hypothetical protein
VKSAGPSSYVLREDGNLWYVAFTRTDGRPCEIWVRTKQAALAELQAAGIEVRRPARKAPRRG